MKIQLPVEIYNAMMTALAERPFKEVGGLIAAIERQRVVVNDPPPEPAPSPAPTPEAPEVLAP